MRGRRERRPGSTGIGGFMEAVLAMMVVICGVMLVTTSLSFVGIGLLRDSSSALLQEGCRSVSDQFFSLGRPFFEAEVLQNSSLFMLNTSLFHCGTSVRGFCIALQDVTAGTHTSGSAFQWVATPATLATNGAMSGCPAGEPQPVQRS